MKDKYKIPGYLLASKKLRFLNYAIDTLIKYSTITMFILLLDFIFYKNKIGVYFWFESLKSIESYVFWSIISFFYYGITEILLSRSLAKYFTKTIVVMEDGTKPKPMDILARTALRLIPLEGLSFLQGRTLGLHDKNSKTFVVKKDKLEQSIKDFNEFY